MDTPSNCRNCNLCKKMSDNCYYCIVTNKIIVDIENKTHWCPLKELPQKMEGKEYSLIKIGEKKGYNACIDDILKGSGIDG